MFLPDKNKQKTKHVSGLKKKKPDLCSHGVPVHFPFKPITQFYIYFVN